MPRLIAALILLALGIAGLWLGAETLLARQIRDLSAAGAGFHAGGTAPLRRTDRIGVALTDVAVKTPLGVIAAPQAQLFLRPMSPTTLLLDLPPQISLDQGNGPQPLTLSDPRIQVRLRLMSRLAPDRLHVSSGAMTLAGLPLARSLTLDAVMVPLGGDAPHGSGSAYEMALDLTGIEPAPLPPLAQAMAALGIAGQGAASAQARLWLDRAATPAAIATAQPRLTGLRIDHGQLSLGGLNTRIAAYLRPDAAGLAQGALAVYTSDADRMLDAAAVAGWIPEGVVKLTGTMLRGLSGMPLPGEAEAADPGQPHPMTWPKIQAGEVRLPILFSQGRTSLGPLRIGPAPVLAPVLAPPR
ncbi:MAG: DUF2125 domain-containing protein [Paracoccus sp. (in: a-proteobacteria)]|uniref:DUF2125 domain-containing protein n=1 Tax=Paracoccus sp. TaxID=267 RepID=UPI0039E33EB2